MKLFHTYGLCPVRGLNLGRSGVKQSELRRNEAYETSRGIVSKFLKWYTTDHPGVTWGVCKQELTDRFGEARDPQRAFANLRQMKQKPGESVQLYAERLLCTATEAFAQQQGRVGAVQQQLIGIFTDRLAFEYLKLRVMRDDPQDLRTAVRSAQTKQNVRARLSSRPGMPSHSDRIEQPMEIDHNRFQGNCMRCGRKGHKARECHHKTVHEVRQESKQQPKGACYNCGKMGHFQRECKKPRKRQQDSWVGPRRGYGNRDSWEN